MSDEIQGYNLQVPKKVIENKGYYKEEADNTMEVEDYIKKYNDHPRVKENGLIVTKKFYFWIFGSVIGLLLILLVIVLLVLNSGVSKLNDKEYTTTIPITVDPNISINMTSQTDNAYTNEIVNNHEIVNQINLTMGYDIDQDAINEIINGINENLCDEDLRINITCSFNMTEYNCTRDNTIYKIDFKAYYNDTKINGTIQEI